MGRMLWLALLLFWSPVDEGWVTHAVALSPDLKTVARGRMHAEQGTSRVLIEDAKTGKAHIDDGCDEVTIRQAISQCR